MTTRQQRRAQERINAKLKRKPFKVGAYIRVVLRGVGRLLKAVINLPWWVNVLGLLATLAAIYEVYYATIPEIDVPEFSDVASPFAPPFQIHNRGLFLSSTDIIMKCDVDQVASEHGVLMRGGSVISDAIPVIEPGGTGNMRCAIGRVGDPESDLVRVPSDDKITKAHVIIYLQYRTLGVLRHTAGTEFTWFNTPSGHFWVKGEIAKEQ